MTVIDIAKANSELERMIKGEIPFNFGYIEELIEANENEVLIEFGFVCEGCNRPAEIVACKECELVAREDCSLCDGIGWWFECQYCNDDESGEISR